MLIAVQLRKACVSEIVSNMASTSNPSLINELLARGVIELMANLLDAISTTTTISKDYASVLDSAIWAFGNISGDSDQTRRMLNEVNIGIKLMKSCNSVNATRESRGTTLWALSNLTKGSFPPILLQGGAWVAQFISDSSHAEEALLVLKQLSHGPDENQISISNIPDISSRLITLLYSLMKNPDFPVRVMIYALQTLGNLLSGPSFVTLKVIDAGILDALKQLIGVKRKILMTPIMWCLSNILAENGASVQRCLDLGLIQSICDYIHESNHAASLHEACWALSNAVAEAKLDAIPSICRSRHFITSFTKALQSWQDNLVRHAIGCTIRILPYGQQIGSLYHAHYDDPEAPPPSNPFADYIYAKLTAEMENIIENDTASPLHTLCEILQPYLV